METKKEHSPNDYKGFMRDTEFEIADFWDKEDIFKKSLAQRKRAKPFVFFDGPPTANGLPHIGHFLTRIYKDLYGRYKTMRGFFVLRRAGWDTHGLPVELEIEKELGLKNKKDIEQYGIANFNAKAKASVWKYKGLWEKMTRRVGFWLDMENPYITYESTFMESVWWVIAKIWERKLLFQGHKVLPFCTRCGTALSSHEVAQGYADITDTSAFVKFKLKPGQSIAGIKVPANTYIVAWTTTPWTLPGNVALAVGEKIDYVMVNAGEHGRLIVAKERLSILDTSSEMLQEFQGTDMIGLEYQSLFDIKVLHSDLSYKVYPADFVTTTDGSGIVHTAVMYGEDDYNLGKELNLPMRHTVNMQGRFTDDVPVFAGRYVKQAEPDIIMSLKERGFLLKTEPFLHTYPHCWRCKTPLIYYAKNSWFIRMSSLRKQLVHNNKSINWTPDHLRDGRFGEFIKEAKDWALSRERYWGTPLPIWQCEHCGHQRVIGSLKELEQTRYNKKNTYYLVRHSLSTKTKDDLIASELNHDTYDLTTDGVKKLDKTIEALRAKGVDVIVSSPFLRTKHTAQIIGDALGLSFEIDERLKELGHGSELEGKPHTNCQVCKGATMDTRLYSGETRREVKARMFGVVRDLEQKYAGKKIAIVSHGDPLWLLESAMLNLSDDEVFSQKDAIYPREAEVKTLTLKNYPYNDMGDLDMHRPYIDSIVLKCAQCSHEMTRVVDLIDVWFDSGAMPYAQWHYPFENKKRVDSVGHDRQFPADFIVEAIDQTRGWFYTMLAISTALGRPAPYKNVSVLGFVTNDKGKKLSKSEGAGEGFGTILEQNSVDALRWYFYTVSDVGEDKRFALPEVDAKIRSFHAILLNTLRFLELYKPKKPLAPSLSVKPKTVLDQWLYVRTQGLIAQVTEDLDAYRPTFAARHIETFLVNDLSQWWLRLSRPRFQHPESDATHAYASAFLVSVLGELSKLLAPFMPFMAEYCYRELGFAKKAESVHLEDWSRAKKLTQADKKLLKDMLEVRELVTLCLGQRKNANLKVRQPLASATIKRAIKFKKDIEDLMKGELNIKKILYNNDQEELIMLDQTITEELRFEGYAREIMRQMQDMRKEFGYDFAQRLVAEWQSDSPEITTILERFHKEITTSALIVSFKPAWHEGAGYDTTKDIEIIPGTILKVGLKKQ